MDLLTCTGLNCPERGVGGVQRNQRDKYNRNAPPVSTFFTRKGLKLPVELQHNTQALVDLKKVTAFLLPYISGRM
jgi:hypothetical protein